MKSSPEAALARALLALALLALALPGDGARAQTIVGDGIPQALTDTAGDPARGRSIVATRQKGLCLLCHTGPFPEERFQGNLAPSLAGTGSRSTPAQLRLRLVDPRRLNPVTLMPPYFSTDGLTRVGASWAGKTVLSAQEIEDVIAFLSTLKE